MARGPFLELENESDRAAAILCAAFLDHQLAVLLRRFMRDVPIVEELFAGSQPLATFSARIKLTYALGLIDEEAFRDLDLIRRIRNDFAHTRELKQFSDPGIASRCRELTLPSIVPQAPAAPRQRFETATMVALGMLGAYEEAAHAQKRLAPNEQPTPREDRKFRGRDVRLSTVFHGNERVATLNITFASETAIAITWEDPEDVLELANEFRLLSAMFKPDPGVTTDVE